MSLMQLPDQLNAAEALVDSHLAAGRAEKTAILAGDRAISYRELHESVNRFGNAMLELGVRREERVAILLPDSPEWVSAFFGTIKMGAVAVPMNTLLSVKEYEYLLNDSRARALVVHADLLDRIGPIRDRLRYLEHIITVGGTPAWELGFDSLVERAAPQLDTADTVKDETAFWLYSSGTTGRPKGAIHLQHDMLVAADAYAKETIGLLESDVSFSVAKLFFAYGLGNGLYFPLRTGGTTILLPDRPVPDKVFETIDRYQPTVYYGVPTSYAAMLHAAEKEGRTDLGRVRMCVSAGETLPRYIFQQWRDRFGVEILDGIGSTEILHIFISNRPGHAKAGSTGQVIPGFEGKIVDDAGVALPPGHVGTLLMKGDSIAQGYWNQHEATKRTFCGEWINTHDKFMVDQDGFFWYSGRSDDMLKVSGQAVWPTEVEGLLHEHPAVLESGVTGAADDEGLLKPVAFVVLKDGQAASPELARELQAFVKKNTLPHKYPRAVVFVESLPKTATGKIKRFELRHRAAVDGVLRNRDAGKKPSS
ncbi:MAG: benzoate-CoA ligase family protein [Patescibacteria group bacterium]|nr:benzoate-CoA ligase family protein [Patescibacteria group bacterium]